MAVETSDEAGPPTSGAAPGAVASLGRLLDLSLRPARRLTWFGPSWALLCGAVASGGLGLSKLAVLRLLVAFVLAEPILGGVYRVTVFGLAHARLPGRVAPGPLGAETRLPRLPFTQPGSPSARLVTGLEALLARWAWPTWSLVRLSVLELGFLLLVASALALLLGEQVFAVTLASLAVALAQAWLWGRRGQESLGLLAVFDFSLPWLVGYFSFRPDPALAPGHWRALFAALGLYSLIYLACVGLRAGKPKGPGLIAIFTLQLVAAACLLAFGSPLLAVTEVLLLYGQAILAPALIKTDNRSWYLTETQYYLMGSLLATSLAVAT
ncbi:MAG: hypothetical protein HY783_05345 [Chloroflexi bacterium]|nr:hypothetical protein [Chloroflexota bacterium]